ncbi:hypothetical protein AYO43_01805 [Nitrospira sp. SCGC AG-212-E16]|nr:hypothetical protein AYO43_01805 [Nitrospira sp. SCGC AG-212-E16]
MHTDTANQISAASAAALALSQFGQNGTSTMQSPNAWASGQIQPLAKSPLDPQALATQRCAALADGEFSGDTLIEKGGNERAGIDVDLARETTVLSLRQVAPAGFLTQAFAVDSPAGCQS